MKDEAGNIIFSQINLWDGGGPYKTKLIYSAKSLTLPDFQKQVNNKDFLNSKNIVECLY